MSTLTQDIEAGKQRGHSKSIKLNGVNYWCGAAIQKYQENYKAHVFRIKEEDIAAEEYEVYLTKEFESLDEAIRCVGEKGNIPINEFGPLKGQKIFNPSWEE